MTANEFKVALHRGDPLLGTLLTSPAPFWPKVIAGCGLDFVFIDTEHIALNREIVSWMCRTYGAMGLPPLVRIPGHDPDDATMALDDGAAGVIIPYAETAATVRTMVGATKLRPLKGRRLTEALMGQALDPRLNAYIEDRNAGHLLIVNIESVPAMEALDEILAVEGLDGILIGPHDLSTSLNVPEDYEHPTFLEACQSILSKARAAGVGAGIHHWLAPDQQMRFIDMGANLLIHKADAIFLKTGLESDLTKIRRLLGQGPSDTGKGSLEI